MTGNKLTDQIKRFCRDHANPAVVKKYSRYFKEGYDAYGLTDKDYAECEELISGENVISLKAALEIAPTLLRSGKYEETFFAIRFVKKHVDKYTPATFNKLEKWFRHGIVNWAHADVFAGSVMAAFLTRNIVPLSAFEWWREAPAKYQRRSAPVVLVEYLKLEKNIKPMLAFVEPLMMDQAREVHQGVGWFLREAWKIDKALTERFLYKWKDTAPRLIFQYATEKMTAEGKKKFKRSK